MIDLILLAAQLAIFLAGLFLCFRLLRKTSLPVALLVSLVVTAGVPYLLCTISFRLGFAIYTFNPSLWYPSWDIGLAFGTWIVLVLSYVIGFISWLVYGWQRLRKIRTPRLYSGKSLSRTKKYRV